MRRAALVTLALEPAVRERWQRVCEPQWREYADRHGMDVVRIDAPFDPQAQGAARHRDWQRCLVLESDLARSYERIVCVDAEVLIRPDAPSILDLPIERIGAVDEAGALVPEDATRIRRTLHALGGETNRVLTPQAWYAAAGFPTEDARVLHGGVLVLSPAHHRTVLRRAYARAAATPDGGWLSRAGLSWELLASGCVQELDPRFGTLWLHQQCLRFPFLFSSPDHSQRGRCATLAFRDNFFLSFAGDPDTLDSVDVQAPHPEVVEPAPGSEGAPAEPPRAPVALIVFNRPEIARRVFEAVRAARPPRLFLIADGPRADHPQDAVDVPETRRIVSSVDWPCDVQTLFSDTHLGVRRRVDTGLAWLFAHADAAIVLEDDCLPDATFFRFCEDLLERYRDDDRVLSIGGTNFLFGLDSPVASYYFSRYPTSWGWASWRRAFERYDGSMSEWPRLAPTSWLERLLEGSSLAEQYWRHILARNHADGAHWDAAWLFSGWVSGGLHVMPSANLVSNIGFGAGATHTLAPWSEFADRPHEPLSFPLRHPVAVERDARADAFLEETLYSGRLAHLVARLRRRTTSARAALEPA